MNTNTNNNTTVAAVKRVCDAVKANAMARARSRFRFADDRLSRTMSRLVRTLPCDADMQLASFGDCVGPMYDGIARRQRQIIADGGYASVDQFSREAAERVSAKCDHFLFGNILIVGVSEER